MKINGSNCLKCNKKFKSPKSAKRKFCCLGCYQKFPKSEETKRKLREKGLGENNHFYGKKHSEKTRKGMRAGWKGNSKKRIALEKRNSENNPMKNSLSREKNSNSLKEGYKSGRIKVWNKGLRKENSKWAKRNSERMIKNNPMKQKSIAKKVSDFKKGKVNPSFKKLRNTDEFMKKIIKSLNIKPNKPETIIINLIQQNNLNFIYVGDGKKIIEGFNPDFINEEKKLIIEHFGNYWHNKEDVKKRDKIRFKTYRKNNYETLVIWQNELQTPNQVLNKIQNFQIKHETKTNLTGTG